MDAVDRDGILVFRGLHLDPHPRFDTGEDTLAAATRLRCYFPQAGRYTVQVWFYQEQGSDVLKAEVPFSVTKEGD
jgi:hypothetical protein